MEQLKPQDAAFLYMESDQNLAHVLGFTLYDPSTAPGGKVSFEAIRNHIHSRLDYSPLFRRRLVRLPLEIDYPYWADDPHFDLDNHLLHGRLPEPADWQTLRSYLARYHTQPVNLRRPPWEISVIEGVDRVPGIPKGCFALAVKMHHVAVDGTSATQFFAALADSDAVGTPMVKLPEVPKTQAPGWLTMGRRALGNNLTAPLRLARSVVRMAPAVVKRVLDQGSENSAAPVPDTRFNRPVSARKVFDGLRCSLDELKAIRAGYPEAKLNDVILAVCAGGLRKYLTHHGELPDDPLVAWVPVNTRVAGKEDSGNNLGAMTVCLHTGVDDPLQQLAAITRSSVAAKQSKSGLAARLMTELGKDAPALPQALSAHFLATSGGGPRVCNLFVSNVPGSPVPQFMAGALAVTNYALAPLNNGMGLFIGTPSYNNQMTFSVTSTREIMPDTEVFIDCLRSALGDLLQAATRSGEAAANKKKPRKKTARKKVSSARRRSSARSRGKD